MNVFEAWFHCFLISLFGLIVELILSKEIAVLDSLKKI